jgi:four helix bundle protein
MKSRSYRDLVAWQRGLDLYGQVFLVSKSFPADEMYGMTSQMRRAASSIPSNIAEGQKRGSTKEFAHFLRIAYGSCAELDTQIELCFSVGYINKARRDELAASVNELMKIINGLIDAIA